MTPSRRAFLALGAAAIAAPATAHTPYGQWVVYRQKHLLIGAHRGDPRTYVLAKSVVIGLDLELPEASARVARGPRPERIASLMGTGQLFLAVLSADEALRMSEAEAPFEDYPPTPVHVIAEVDGEYLLLASPDFPEDHARLVTEALDHANIGARPEKSPLPVHPGAAAHWASRG